MNLIFSGPYIVIYSYNRSQQDAQFSTLFCYTSLHVSDKLTVCRCILPLLNTWNQFRVSVDPCGVDCLSAVSAVTDRRL